MPTFRAVTIVITSDLPLEALRKHPDVVYMDDEAPLPGGFEPDDWVDVIPPDQGA